MPNGTWLRTGVAGNWNVTTDWVGGTIASGADSTAYLTSDVTAIYSVFVPSGYAVTIANIIFSDGGADGFARYLAGGGSSDTQTGGTLTLSTGGATQPVINTIQAAHINPQTTRARMILAGTNGFQKTGTQILVIKEANGAGHTISGVITVSAGTLYLGEQNNGATNVLPSATSFVAEGGNIIFQGLGGYTESRAFSGTASVYNYAPSTITFSNTAWRTFPGYAQVITDGVITAATSNFLTHFPATAAFLLAQCNNSGASAATATMIFSHDYAVTYAGKVALYSSTASTGGKFVLQDNGTASTDYQGTAYRYQTSSTGSTVQLDLSGSNNSCTYSGRIRNNEGTAAGNLSLRKSGAGTWTLSGDNDFTGGVSVAAGTLKLRHANALGTTGAVTQTGGTIDIAGGINLNKAGITITLVSVSGADAVYVPDGNNTLTCAGISVGTPTNWNVASGAKLTLANSAAMAGTGSLVKLGDGELDMGSFANTFDGTTTISAGKLTIGNLQNGGTASSLGDGSSAIALTGTLAYAGSSNGSTNRSITFTGAAPALESNGAGTVDYNACSQAAGSRTIVLGGTNTTNNKVSAAITDATGEVRIQKTGVGKWQLTGALSHTGTTSVNEGTLDLGDTPRTLTGQVQLYGGTLTNGNNNTLTAPVRLSYTGGTVKATLVGSASVSVTTTGTGSLYPQTATGSNSYTGTTVVDAGSTLQLFTDASPATAGQGKVTGDGNVTVNGYLKTGAGANQRGQARYGGNLTFGAGSKLYIGAAA